MLSMIRCLILLLLLAATRPTMSQRSRTDTLLIHFAFDKSEIRPADSSILADTHGGADSILIVGYTDTVGSTGYNLKLSRHRAEAARAALLRSLTSAQAQSQLPIRLEARGKTNPLPGDDSLSRRVEILVFYKVAAPIAQTPPPDTPRARPDDEPDTTFALDNINFVANTPILTDAARQALPGSVAFLRNFSDHYLEIDGFCNSPGAPLPPTDPLFILSVKRAKFIYDYLIQQGFDSTHLRYKGLGNASPVIAHPTTREESDKNMRVEIRVFHKPPPQQQQ
jgi:outer membrane protein OmpA-like peptidoglycan-associated protein